MKKQRTPLAVSKNGVSVWYDPISSHAATHIEDTPDLLALAIEVVRQTTIDELYVQLHVDFGRIVGTSDLVENDPADEIVYAKRLNRDEYTAFNKTRAAQPSSLVTIALRQQDDGTYELVSTWIGASDSPAFPGTKQETRDSREFWSTHSLAWGNQEIQPGSETTHCPW